MAQESPHQIRQSNLEITSTYKYDIRNTYKLCYALPFPSNNGRRRWGFVLRPMLPSDAARLHTIIHNINKEQITLNKLTINNNNNRVTNDRNRAKIRHKSTLKNNKTSDRQRISTVYRFASEQLSSTPCRTNIRRGALQ